MENIKNKVKEYISKVTAYVTTYQDYVIGFCIGVIVMALFK